MGRDPALPQNLWSPPPFLYSLMGPELVIFSCGTVHGPGGAGSWAPHHRRSSPVLPRPPALQTEVAGLTVPAPAPSATSPPSPAPAPPCPPRFVALYSYAARGPDELDLRKGEGVRVLGRYQDGWLRGVSLVTGRVGIFPNNYVSPIFRCVPSPLGLLSGWQVVWARGRVRVEGRHALPAWAPRDSLCPSTLLTL